MKIRLAHVLLVVSSVLLAGCVTPPTGPNVDSDEPGGVSATPRPSDVREAVSQVVEAILNQMDFKPQVPGKIPYIAFTGIKNESAVQWNEYEIAGWIEQDILTSKLAIPSSATDPNQKGGRSGHQYKQIDFQDEDNEYVDRSTAIQKGGIQGADFELFGRIYDYDELETRGGTEVNYVIELTLSNLRTGGMAFKKMVPIRKNVR